jgi:phosphoribosylglycinamide formyltransferase-1
VFFALYYPLRSEAALCYTHSAYFEIELNSISRFIYQTIRKPYFRKIVNHTAKKINLAIFASGSGTNAENIAKYFKGHGHITVKSIYTNNPKAFVIERMKPQGFETRVFTRDEFNSGIIVEELKKQDIDYIILAGFLWLVPQDLIEAYDNRIINIHPALLPKYGGKGMYGIKVHEAVKANSENETGITIHLVNTEYDKGEIIFQAKCDLSPEDTSDDIAHKIHDLEQRHFPQVIETFLMKQIRTEK